MRGRAASWDDVLDSRAADLARRTKDEARGVGLPVLAFVVDGGLYGLPLPEVTEVLSGRPPVRWPGAPAAVLGLVGHAGRAIAVLDLQRLLGTQRSGERAGPGMLVVLNRHGRRLALSVDRAVGVMTVEPEPDRSGSAVGEAGVRWAAIRAAGPEKAVEAPATLETLALLDPERLTLAVAPHLAPSLAGSSGPGSPISVRSSAAAAPAGLSLFGA